ncbi:MAG: AraC family transcriptional regulator [Acetobacter sp.]|nr:AraC family transcriptional regulator [Bacteroides sp.]MCM1340179.1 AraC family transcriptional regulator [Acetobacter sp.]MCM1432869.1 AraC family transcriptional regulator [Clostridiales bacterium]
MAITFYYNNSKIQIFKIFSGTIDEIVQMHSHTKHGYELHLIDSGKGILDTEDNRYNLSKNVLYVTGPRVLHKQTPVSENPMHELCVYLEIPNSKNTDSTVQYFSKQNFWIGKSNASIRQIFRQMNEESEKDSLFKESVLSSLAIRLIVEMTRLYYPENTNTLLSKHDTDLNESRSWILDQLLLEDCSNVKLEDFAKGMGVCPRQAERIIKNYYGSSFKKLRYESKMARAATLLEQENISIEDCSARCGYSSFSAFCSAFKRKYKITPKEYQKLHNI